jgi:soluble lytic murein transglycosylase-like protein
MKLILCVSIACSPACSTAAVAQMAQLHRFSPESQKSEPFTLRTPDHQAILLPTKPTAEASLASDFAQMSGQATAPATPPQTITSMPVPRWMKESKVAATASIQAASQMVPSKINLPCQSSSYTPTKRLPAEAERRRSTWYSIMAATACDAGVPVHLFDALIMQESRYNPAALSPKGAAGLAQLMPASARYLGVSNIWNPTENMRGGARYLRQLLDEFGRFDLALAAYNAGPARVRSTGRVPRIHETIAYVSAILLTMRDQLAGRSGRETSPDALFPWQPTPLAQF